MRKPYIKRGLVSDLYLAPLELRKTSTGHTDSSLVLAKGESIQIADYNVTFLDFEMSAHSQGGEMRIGAILEVSSSDNKQTLTPYQIVGGPEVQYQDVTLPDQKTQIALQRIMADTRQVGLLVNMESEIAQPTEALLLEISHKPLINLLWLGGILVMLGSLFSIFRRSRE